MDMKSNKRMAYTARERREIRRGTSWHNPKYINYTKSQFKAEMKSLQKLLKKSIG